MRGFIKRLVPDKGFAFVRDKATREDFFLHATVNPEFFMGTFEGETVEFEGGPTERGLRVTAINRL
jgi:cold shock CspA family protein